MCEQPSGRTAGLVLLVGEGHVLVLPHSVHTLVYHQGLILDVAEFVSMDCLFFWWGTEWILTTWFNHRTLQSQLILGSI